MDVGNGYETTRSLAPTAAWEYPACPDSFLSSMGPIAFKHMVNAVPNIVVYKNVWTGDMPTYGDVQANVFHGEIVFCSGYTVSCFTRGLMGCSMSQYANLLETAANNSETSAENRCRLLAMRRDVHNGVAVRIMGEHCHVSSLPASFRVENEIFTIAVQGDVLGDLVIYSCL